MNVHIATKTRRGQEESATAEIIEVRNGAESQGTTTSGKIVHTICKAQSGMMKEDAQVNAKIIKSIVILPNVCNSNVCKHN